MNRLVEAAKKFATKAHEGQSYGSNKEPFIVHPTQAALVAERLGYCDEVIAGCYLHDILEDTDVTEATLRREFPKMVIDAVVAVTFFGPDNDLKINQAMSHPIGHVIKFCDASSNFSNTILYDAKPGQKDTAAIPRLATYISKLLDTLPTPQETEAYIKKERRTTT